MKKLLALLLALSLFLCCLAESAEADVSNPLKQLLDALAGEASEAAGLFSLPTGQEPEAPAPDAPADPAKWKTLADVLGLETDSRESTWDDARYILFFDYGGTQWFVTAEFSKELKDAIWAVDFFADDRAEQINAILGPCRIISAVDLSTLALPQAELDQWIGKTGRQLLDAGWEYNGFRYGDDGLRVNMVNGRFEYLISFREKLQAPMSFDDQPDFADAVISGVAFGGKSYHFFDDEDTEQPPAEEEAPGDGDPNAVVTGDWAMDYFGIPLYIYLYEDGTGLILIADDSIPLADDGSNEAVGTWEFDGETLILHGEDDLALHWDPETHQLTGEVQGTKLVMYRPIEPEQKD